MKKVFVDESKCIGCGACVAIDPENFDFNDEGYSTVIDDTPNEKAQDALEACPVFAITIEDDKDEKNTNDNISFGSESNCENDCGCNEDCACDGESACDGDCCCGHHSSEDDIDEDEDDEEEAA